MMEDYVHYLLSDRTIKFLIPLMGMLTNVYAFPLFLHEGVGKPENFVEKSVLYQSERILSPIAPWWSNSTKNWPETCTVRTGQVS